MELIATSRSFASYLDSHLVECEQTMDGLHFAELHAYYQQWLMGEGSSLGASAAQFAQIAEAQLQTVMGEGSTTVAATTTGTAHPDAASAFASFLAARSHVQGYVEAPRDRSTLLQAFGDWLHTMGSVIGVSESDFDSVAAAHLIDATPVTIAHGTDSTAGSMLEVAPLAPEPAAENLPDDPYKVADAARDYGVSEATIRNYLQRFAELFGPYYRSGFTSAQRLLLAEVLRLKGQGHTMQQIGEQLQNATAGEATGTAARKIEEGAQTVPDQVREVATVPAPMLVQTPALAVESEVTPLLAAFAKMTDAVNEVQRCFTQAVAQYEERLARQQTEIDALKTQNAQMEQVAALAEQMANLLGPRRA